MRCISWFTGWRCFRGLLFSMALGFDSLVDRRRPPTALLRWRPLSARQGYNPWSSGCSLSDHREADIAAVNGVAAGAGVKSPSPATCGSRVRGLIRPGIRQDRAGAGRRWHALPADARRLRQGGGTRLHGGTHGAAECLRLGLVNEVVPADALMETTQEWPHASPFFRRAPSA